MPGKSVPAPATAPEKLYLVRLRTQLHRLSSWSLDSHGGARPSAFEAVHLLLLANGLLVGGGRVSGAALAAGAVGLAFVVLPRLDIQALWRCERRFVVCCSRELVLATLAIYIDSVAVYLVAVSNKHRGENIELQDNVRIVLEAVCHSCPSLEAAFLRFPELYAEEAIFLSAALGVLAAARAASGFSLLATVARLAQALRWCRLLRVACYVSTVMPSQTRNCFLNRYDETYSTAEHWREALSHWRAGGGCNDLVFSGHLVVLGLCALLHGAHCRDAGAGGGWLPVLVWCRLGHAALRIIHGHFHMSVDLVVSLTVTCFAWHALPSPGRSAPAGSAEGDSGPWDGEASDLDELFEAPARSGRAAPRCRWGDRRARGWLAALALTALLGFGLLAASSNQAGPLSAYNRRRLHRISVAGVDGHGGAGSLAQGARRPRLLCAMLHIEEADSVRAAYAGVAAETWGWRCDGLLLWDERRADIAPLDMAAAEEEPAMDSPASDRWLRVRRMWRYIGRHALPHYDWFVAVDDGGFVVAENLLKATAALEVSHEPGRPLYLVNSGSVAAPWGYVLNAPAVSELLQAINGHAVKGAPGGATACPLPSRDLTAGEAEYDVVQRCLTDARGIRPIPWEDDPAVQEALGCRKGDTSVVNLKVRADPVKLCRHAVLAYMVPQPGWVREIFNEVYGSKAARKGR